MSKALRKRMFETGSEALSQVGPVDRGLYACPICLRLFDADSTENGQLTVEHVPSRALGGKPLALTCKPCNSGLGHTVDAAAKDRDAFLDFAHSLTGHSNFKGRVRVKLEDGATVNAELAVSDGQFRFQVLDQINDPEKQQLLNAKLHSFAQQGGWEGSRINVSPVKGFNWKLAHRADLKNAYLTVFASLGYAYILRECVQPVRDQLLRPTEDVIGAFALSKAGQPRTMQRLAFVEWPFEAMAVQFGTVFVLLPPPHDVGDFYGRLKEQLDTVAESKHGFRWIELGWPIGLELRMDRRP